MHMKKFPYFSPRSAVFELQSTSPLCASADHEGFTMLSVSNHYLNLTDLEVSDYED